MDLKTSLVASVLALASAGVASAVNYAESGDAGQFPGTAQSTGSALSLTSITGSISGDGDMFRIFIFDPLIFVAATGDLANSNNPIGGLVQDPQLHLFDANGFGVMANDDDGSVLQESRLVGNGSLSAGYYYLLITGYDLDPVSAGGLIFPSGGSETNNTIQGPTGPGGAQPITGLTGLSSGNEGPYQISLIGASGDQSEVVPEPATLALTGAGFVIVGFLSRRKKK
jgi:hypothetical protein